MLDGVEGVRGNIIGDYQTPFRKVNVIFEDSRLRPRSGRIDIPRQKEDPNPGPTRGPPASLPLLTVGGSPSLAFHV